MTNTDTSEHEWSSQKIINVAPNLYDFLFFGTHNEKFQICACCEEKTSCRFEITWGWVTDKRAIIIGCTVPLSTVYCHDLKLETLRSYFIVSAVFPVALLYLSTQVFCVSVIAGEEDNCDNSPPETTCSTSRRRSDRSRTTAWHNTIHGGRADRTDTRQRYKEKGKGII